MPENSPARRVFLCSSELGCPINLSLTTRLHNYARANRWRFADYESADDIVIVSCSTLPTMRKAVAAAAAYFSARYPAKRVVVSGCFVREDRVQAKNVVYVPLSEPEAFDALFAAAVPLGKVSGAATLEDNVQVRGMKDLNAAMNRPFNVMVASGCLSHCAFCIGKSIFPKVESVPLEEIAARCREGLSKGYVNFVIGASDVASYGRDVKQDVGRLFSTLFDDVFAGRDDVAVGFKGFEPSGFMRSFPKLKSYFASGHIAWINLPIQSGSDRVLRDMNRKYKVADVLKTVAELRKAAPKLRIDTDLLFCFPTETAEDFEASLAAAKHFDHVQLLALEKHEGTKAFGMADVFGPEEKERRRKIAASLQKQESDSVRPECRPRLDIELPSPLGDCGFAVLPEERQ